MDVQYIMLIFICLSSTQGKVEFEFKCAEQFVMGLILISYCRSKTSELFHTLMFYTSAYFYYELL
jgi:hypothetical protein